MKMIHTTVCCPSLNPLISFTDPSGKDAPILTLLVPDVKNVSTETQTDTQSGTQSEHNRNTIGTQSEHNRNTIGTQSGHNRKHYIRKRKRIYLKNPLKRVKKALSPLEKIVEYRHIADTYGQASGMFGGVSEKM